MLESFVSCLVPNYSHIVHPREGVISLAPQLNYLTDIILELKVELVKIKAEVKEIKNQLAVTHLSLINEIRHSEKSDLSLNTPFQHKYPFQNLKTKSSFQVQEVKIEKNIEKLPEKSLGKKLEKGDGL